MSDGWSQYKTDQESKCRIVIAAVCYTTLTMPSKKLPLTLAVVSFVFAFLALAISVLGFLGSSRPVEVAEETPAVISPEVAAEPSPESVVAESLTPAEPVCEPVADATPVPIDTKDLGFTIEPPPALGTLSSVLNLGACVGAGTYAVSFANALGLSYQSTENKFIPARGTTYVDIEGYIKGDDGGYEVSMLGGDRVPVPPEIVQGEIDLKVGKALVLSGKDWDVPMPFPPIELRVAVIGTPMGIIPGGVFVADKSISRDTFRSLLQTVSILSP